MDDVDSDRAATGATDFISPGFFATLGVPLLSGRDIAWTDLPTTERVAVVSESLARMLSPDANVVGRVISQQAVTQLIMGHALRLIVCGLAIGIPAAMASTTLVRSMLYGITETDPLTLATSVTALVLTASLGALVPTRRALRIDPATALRRD